MTQNFKNLKVYQEAFSLATTVYAKFRDVKGESFRLREQIFGAISSIPANLAEFSAFESKAQQKQKIIVCIAESNESQFWFDFCFDVKILTEQEHKEFTDRLIKIRKMLFNLLEAVKKEI